MIAFILAVLAGAVLPEVESPWPERIGLDFPFAIAGAFGVGIGLVRASAEPAARDSAVARAGQIGFGAGALVYLLALLFQVLSER